jgi:hypothetical protein
LGAFGGSGVGGGRAGLWLDDGVEAVGASGGAERGAEDLVRPEEADGEQLARHATDGVVEVVQTLLLEVVAVDGGEGAHGHDATGDAQRLEFLEPLAAYGGVVRSQVREHSLPDLAIGIGQRRTHLPARPALLGQHAKQPT